LAQNSSIHPKNTFLHAEKLRDLNSSVAFVLSSVAERDIVRFAVFVATRADDLFAVCGVLRVVTRLVLFVLFALDWILDVVRADKFLFAGVFSVGVLLTTLL
jgi:hypothetical protein